MDGGYDFRRGRPVGLVDAPRPEGVVRVAAFRSLETRRLSRELGFDVAVIATVEDPAVHAAWLSRRWYGALRVRSGWFTAWDTWDAMPSTTAYSLFPFDARWLDTMQLPNGVRLVGGTLECRLPPGGRDRDREFAAAFKAGMADRQFDIVAKAPAAVAYRFRTGRPLEVGARYATPPWGSMRPIIVTDLYAFHPRAFRSVVRRAADALTLVGIRSALATSSQLRAG